MSKKVSIALAISVLLIAAALRIIGMASTPPGLNSVEALDVQIAELIRIGQVEVFYDLGHEGREGLYHIILSAATTFTGNRPLGYRLVSVWLGLLAIAITYTLARRLFGRNIGLISMAALTVPMWSIIGSRMIARESMMPLLFMAVLMSISRALPVYRRPKINPSTIPFGTLGLLLGLGFYIHPAHYVIVLMSMIFIGYMIITRQPMSRRTLSYLSFTIVILIIVATPYLISTIRRPDLGGAVRLFGEYNAISGVGSLSTITNGLLGFFILGDNNIIHNIPGRPYIDPISGIIIIIGILYSIQRLQQPRYALAFISLLLLVPIAVFAPDSPNFYAFTLITPLLAIHFGLGVKQLFYLFKGQTASRLINGLVVLLLTINLGWTLRSLQIWKELPEVKTAYHERVYQLAGYLDRTVSSTATVVCTPQIPNTSVVWLSSSDEPATQLALMMDNPDESTIRYADCGSSMIFTNGGSHQQVIILEEGGLESFPTYIKNWLEQGDIISEGVPEESVVSLIVSEPLSNLLGRFTTTAPAGFAPESPGGVGPAILPINFDRNLTFLGYDKPPSDRFAPGDIVPVTTYWRVDGELPIDLSIFVHMLFDAEMIVSQRDLISVLPGRLLPRDIFVQITFIPIPEDLPAGNYETTIGAYDLSTETRLNILDNGEPRGTRLFLNEIFIETTDN